MNGLQAGRHRVRGYYGPHTIVDYTAEPALAARYAAAMSRRLGLEVTTEPIAPRPRDAREAVMSVADVDGTRPLMLGYLCEPPLHSEAMTEQLIAQLTTFAQAEGYALGTVYVEHLHTAPAAFEALLESVRRYEVDAVVVPSRAHLEPLGEASRLQRLTHETHARVLIAVT